MSAASDTRPFNGLGTGLTRSEVERAWTGPIADNKNLPQGTLAGELLTDANSSPVIYPFVGDGTMRALGFVTDGFDNTVTGHVQGARPVKVEARTGLLVDLNAGGANAIANTDGFCPIYGVDNQTCSKLASDGPLIGIFLQLDPISGQPVVLVDPVFSRIISTVPSVAWSLGAGPLLATAGNDNACTNGDIYWVPVYFAGPTVVAGVQYLIGSVGGTDKAIVALYNSSGVLLGNSALAGTTVGTAANVQPLDFVSPVAIPGAGRYFIAIQFNGTTAKFRTHTLPTLKASAACATGSVAGTFGTLAAITPGTTYTVNKGPIASTY